MDMEDKPYATLAVWRAYTTLGGDRETVADGDDVRSSAGAAIHRGGGSRGASVIGCHLALLSVFQGFHLPPRKLIPYEEEYVD